MLWYKSWLDTRWRFLIGLGLLMIVACGTLFDYVATRQLMPLAASFTHCKIGLGVRAAATFPATVSASSNAPRLQITFMC